MAKLVIEVSDEPLVVPLSWQPVSIGRAPDNVVVLDRSNVSRRHCLLEPLQNGTWRVLDLTSTNGTFLNGEAVSRMALEYDDRIQIGSVMMMFVEDATDPHDALQTSGKVFPWSPVRRRDDPTPVFGIGSVDTPGERTYDDRAAFDAKTRQYPLVSRPRQERERYLRELLTRLTRVGQDVASNLDLGNLMATILAELVGWTGCDRAQLLLYDDDTGMIQPALGHHLDYETVSGRERRFIERTVKQTLERKTIFLQTGIYLTRDPFDDGTAIPPNVDTAICLPLTVPLRLPNGDRRRPGRQRRAMGAIYMDSAEPIAELESETLQLLETVGAQAVSALQNAQLHYQASTDHMTHLYNRMFMWQLLSEELKTARQDGSSVGLILLDLDHLKRINDTWGHAMGDEVIQRVARRLNHAIRKDDIAARWGGEEFLILLAHQPPHGILAVAEKVQEAISNRPIGSQQLRVSASFGIALFPDHGDTADELLRHADEALYHSKHAGRNQITIYPPGNELH
ncbi:MAG: diguanylate cyclase [bacterium]